MDDLTVCRLSADALGKIVFKYGDKIYLGRRGDNAPMSYWNPLFNAEQRWECVEYLLKHGWFERVVDNKDNHDKYFLPYKGQSIYLSCPASEFPARAVAELQRRKEKANG